jgi:hypothetical protein
MSLRRANPSSRGVLPNVTCHCVWSRHLTNKAALASAGLLRQRKKQNSTSDCSYKSQNSVFSYSSKTDSTTIIPTMNNWNNFAQAVSLLTFNLYVSSSGTGRVIKNDYSFITIFICFSRLTTSQSQKLSHIIVLQHSFRHINWSQLLTQSSTHVKHGSAHITSDKIKSFYRIWSTNFQKKLFVTLLICRSHVSVIYNADKCTIMYRQWQVNEWVWSIDGMILTGENRRIWRKSCPSATYQLQIPYGLVWDWTPPAHPHHPVSALRYTTASALLQSYL